MPSLRTIFNLQNSLMFYCIEYQDNNYWPLKKCKAYDSKKKRNQPHSVFPQKYTSAHGSCVFQEVPNNLILSLSQDCDLDAFAYGAGCWVYEC